MGKKFVVILCVALGVRAGEIEPLDLTKLPAQSTIIVTGYVTSSRVTMDGNGLTEKLAIIQVVTVMRGTYAEKSIKVRTRTGLVFFDRHLTAGDSGVFFLQPSPARGDYEAAYPGSFALFQKDTVKRPN